MRNFKNKPDTSLIDKGSAAEHPDYVGVTHGMRGYFAVYMKWNPDHGGFYEPWNTGYGSYRTADGAHTEAKAWAEADEVEYRA